ncbi:MAG: transglutaminase-like domain-containing protein, partial [Armatimonadota bacterium]
MTVQCEEEHLWRGQTFNMYTGQGWSIDLPDEERRIFYPPGRNRTNATQEMHYDREHVSTYYVEYPIQRQHSARIRRVRQRFHILTYERTNILFVAAEPITIRGNVRGPVVRVGGGYRCSEYYGWGTSYEVDSLVVKAAPIELRAAGTNIPRSIRETYLAVPQSCWRVAELVREITLGKYTAFDKARAIEDYLEQHYTYDLRAPATPRTQDAVTFFLLKSKKGYCDLFASAMVIMARQAGIPARWVTGYAPGQYDESKQMFIVRGIDAHAWAELYFPGYGWIAFDPTPSSAPQADLLSRVRVTWERLKSAIVTERKAVAAVILLLVLLA